MSDAPSNAHRRIIREFEDGGTISFEVGADGTFLRFDCECIDALPYCKAACCALAEIKVDRELDTDQAALAIALWNGPENQHEMPRGCNSWCEWNDPVEKTCKHYEDRPQTCREFHCTKGVDMRGWRLDLCRIDGDE